MPKNKANQIKKAKQTRLNFLKQRRYSKKQIAELDKLKYEMLYLFSSSCLSCGDTSKLELDHIKPVSKYPELTFEKSNLQILCKSCNKNKSNINENDYRPNLYKLENWDKIQIKAFRDLVNKRKIYKPIRYNKVLKYKGTLDDYVSGQRELKKRKHLSEKREAYLSKITFTLDDIIYKRSCIYEFYSKKRDNCNNENMC